MKKILIIEDDPIVAQIYQGRLKKEGFLITIASDGQSGFYRIHDFEPDAVLLDLMLPKMNGIDILKKIRAESRFSHTPVIVFTNAYVPNMINEAFQAGATNVFNKATLTPRQIVDCLHSVTEVSVTPAEVTQAETATAPESEEVLTSGFHEDSFHASTPSLTRSAPPMEETRQETMGEPTNGDVVCSEETEKEDSDYEAELHKAFHDSLKEVLAGLRKLTQEFGRAQDETTRLEQLLQLYRKVHALTGSAGIAGFRNIAKMAAAVEVLLKELHDKPNNINASTLRTVAHSIDFLAELCSKGTKGDLIDENPIQILVVDDEILSRRAITFALDKAGLPSINVEDSQFALDLATEYTFDLIFLDVQMPGMNGFDLCTRIRALPTNKKTPVIFVTSLTDFTSRAKSTLSGGADLIAKPFMFIELTVKALTYVLRAHMMKSGT